LTQESYWILPNHNSDTPFLDPRDKQAMRRLLEKLRPGENLFRKSVPAQNAAVRPPSLIISNALLSSFP
jgi:hypothetical protein